MKYIFPTIPMGKIKTIISIRVFMNPTGELFFYQKRLNGYYGWFGKKPKNLLSDLVYLGYL